MSGHSAYRHDVKPGQGRTFAQREALCGVPFILRPKNKGIWPEHGPHHAMVTRCDPRAALKDDNRYWAGLGVRVCPEWQESFLEFALHVGPRPSMAHTIDRFPDGRGDYAPGNVRWATRAEQARNTSASVLLSFRGEQMCILDAVNLAGVGYSAFYRRLRKFNYDSDRAFRALGVDPTPSTIGGC
jgi:hypothetical protein